MTERERLAFNRGVEAAAKIADLWADENCRIFQHTILADPILTGRDKRGAPQPHKGARIQADLVESLRLADQGHETSIRHHAAQDMAKMMRGLKVKA